MKHIALGQQAYRPAARQLAASVGPDGLPVLQRTLPRKTRSWGWLLWLVGPLVALVVTSQWFSPGRLLGGGDNFPGLFPNPGNWIARMPYSWDLTGIGGPTSLVQNAPQLIVVWLLRGALDPAAAQHTFYALLFAAQLLAMMLLILTVLPGHRVAAVLGALFYAFNPATVIVPPGFLGMFMAAFLPGIAALFIRAANEPLRLRHLIPFALIASCSGLLWTNPPTFAILLLSSLLAVAYVVGRHWATKGRIFARIAVLAGLALLANAYWLPDAYFWLHGQANQGGGGLAATVDSWGFVSGRASVLNLFWLSSTWAWDVYFPYSSVYRTPLLLTVVYIPTLLAFSALLHRSMPRSLALAVSVTALITLFLCTGQHTPWGSINLFLFHHVPLFWLFREPNTKFASILLVAYALLVGYQAEWLMIQAARVARRRAAARAVRVGVTTLLAGIFLLSGFPLVTGASVGRGYGAPGTTGFVIPHYWYDLGQYLARVGPADGVLLFPNDDYYQMRYTWGYYGSDGVANEMIYNHVIPVGGELGYVSGARNGSLTGQVLRMLQHGSRGSIVPYLIALGTRYIVQRNDIDATEPNRPVVTPRQVRVFLKNQHDVRFVRSFGLLDLYEIDPRYYVPPVYAVSVPRGGAAGAQLGQRMTRDLVKRLGLLSNGQTSASLQSPQIIRPDVTRQSPVRYTIKVGPTKGPVLLILSTSYHPSWHACLVPDGAVTRPWTCSFGGYLPARDHVAALGFLNGWVIDHPGNYTIIVDYGFQHVADFGIAVSLATLCGLLLACLVRFYGARRRRLATVAAGVL